MDRKDFIRQCGLLSLTGMGIAAALQSCKAVLYVPANDTNNLLTINKADITDKNLFLVKSAKLPAPLYLSLTDKGEYTATLMLCTHKNCELAPAGNYLHCPCHGSEFTAQGKVTQGPAEEDLKTFPVSSDNANIYIHIQ